MRFTFGTPIDLGENTVLGVPMWSTDLTNWHFLEQNAEGLSFDYSMSRFDMGLSNPDINYDFHDFSVTGGSTDKLFFKFMCCPNE